MFAVRSLARRFIPYRPSAVAWNAIQPNRAPFELLARHGLNRVAPDLLDSADSHLSFLCLFVAIDNIPAQAVSIQFQK
jgi:hypothetical protein